MTGLTGLIGGQGGVYRILAPEHEIESTLTASGWRVVPLPEIGRTREFYAGLREALGLPDWTGSNLDALWDVLTDLTEPTALVWPGFGSFALARPDAWRRILSVMDERAAQDPPFALVLA